MPRPGQVDPLHPMPPDFPSRLRAANIAVLSSALLWLLPPSALAAPFLPTSDQQVLERLPSKAGDARAREFADLRRQLAARPDDLGLAVK
ncbi:MAG: hypothetical protein RL722_2102, partial [Pseudomonadota bacterium]